jgi:hypothetical protein
MHILEMMDHPLADDLPFYFLRKVSDIVLSKQKCPYAAFAA